MLEKTGENLNEKFLNKLVLINKKKMSMYMLGFEFFFLLKVYNCSTLLFIISKKFIQFVCRMCVHVCMLSYMNHSINHKS